MSMKRQDIYVLFLLHRACMMKRIRKSTTRITKTSRMKHHQMICNGFSQGEINVRRTGNDGPSGKLMGTPI
jgi:hypothetical protein